MIPRTGSAQQINWRNLTGNKTHLLNVNMGWDYGSVAGIGYGQKLRTKLPVVVNVEYSSPFGKKQFDDFKTKLAVQAEVLKLGDLSVSVKIAAIYRRYENSYATLSGYGSEFSTNIGYYRPRWYAAGLVGFDKAISTHIKNGEPLKDTYPGIQDGWYVPTAGNFSYGIVSGYSIRRNDVYLKFGKTVTQDLKTVPASPFFLQIGFNRRF